jgi:predicted TIM-barrel fold metal-dependent hydrolase
MIIDAHNHPDWHGHDLDRFLENMDRYGIEKTWLLTWECPIDEFDPSYNSVLANAADPFGPIPFARALSYVERAPERFVLGYAPDPRRPDAIDRLEAAVAIHGVRVCGEIKLRMMYDNRDAIRYYKRCGELALPITFHIDYEFDRKTNYPRPNYWYGGGIAAFERAIAECPDTVFVGHAPGFWAHISGDGKQTESAYPDGAVLPGGKLVEMFRAYPNLHADLSAGSGFTALNRDHSFAVDFLTEFQDRILFGRDYFDDRMRALIEELPLTDEVRKKIYRGNAMRLVQTAEDRARK